jgi:pimeloyl-ACP methyl ester carboxylesterase
MEAILTDPNDLDAWSVVATSASNDPSAVHMVLVHGAGGTKYELEPLVECLGTGFQCWSGNLLGHGGREMPERYGLEEVAEDLLQRLDSAGVPKAYFFGYSFGGNVASYIARYHPERVYGCCTLSTKFIWDEAIIRFALHILDPERQARLGVQQESWQDALDEIHRRLLLSLLEKGQALTEEELQRIEIPTLILNGTEDPAVSADEARRIARLIPTCRLAIFEGSAHPPPNIPFEATAEQIKTFVRDVRRLSGTA